MKPPAEAGLKVPTIPIIVPAMPASPAAMPKVRGRGRGGPDPHEARRAAVHAGRHDRHPDPGAVHHRHEGHGHKNREDEGEQPAERDLHPATAKLVPA